mmetsp:Transcript_73320/g.189146  ORF Transcript_73320/g.189146 Transcript_73320/m.189146 type:complete len:286 (-) Transcript_73320:35-892(-)
MGAMRPGARRRRCSCRTLRLTLPVLATALAAGGLCTSTGGAVALPPPAAPVAKGPKPQGRRAVLPLLAAALTAAPAAPANAVSVSAVEQSYYMSSGSGTQAYFRFDADGQLTDVIRANLTTRVVRPPADQAQCHGAEDGDLVSIRYVAAYELKPDQAEARGAAPAPVLPAEASIDLFEDPETWDARWSVFDASDFRALGIPYRLPLGDRNAIAGLEMGLHGMCAGERRTLYIPAALAFGRSGSRAFQVPPNANLRYDVELQDMYSFSSTSTSEGGSWRVVGQVIE